MRCFVAVAQSRSFSLAAERLSVAQPWLSQSIKRLEQKIGLELFERSTRSVALTAAGKALLAHTRRLLDDAQLLSDAIRSQRENAMGLLRLGTAQFLADWPGRNHLVENLSQRYPDLLFEVRTAWLQRLIDTVLNEEIDAALVTGPLDHPDLDMLLLKRTSMEVVVPRKSPLARHRLIPIDALRGERVGLWKLHEHSSAGRLLDKVLKSSGVRPTSMPDDNFQSSLAHAARLDLVIPAPTVLLDCAQLPSSLVRRRFRDDPFAIDICLIRKRGRTNPGLDALWQIGGELAER
ncbi:MAG: LysR family transcriptional regulator [Pseudoxanthomonas sp.]